METCSFVQFMHTLKPWLNRDYIRKAFIDARGDLRLMFVDGGERVFRIEDCSRNNLSGILQELNGKGVPVEKYDPAISGTPAQTPADD